MGITIKSDAEIIKMRTAGRMVADLLDMIEAYIKPGVTTGFLDDLCRDFIADHNCVSACLGFGYPPYPKHTCISVNHVVCHGIPGQKKLREGDILNIDVTVIVDGYHGDSSRMYVAGKPSIAAKRLIDTTYSAMWQGIEQVRPGVTLGDIGHTIQKYAESARFSVVREFCGHGIGKGFHEDPQVPNFGRPGKGIALKKGMVFTIEPMLNVGERYVRELKDSWTTVTRDRSLSAQWEHMLAVTDNGFEVLTLSKAERDAGTPAMG